VRAPLQEVAHEMALGVALKRRVRHEPRVERIADRPQARQAREPIETSLADELGGDPVRDQRRCLVEKRRGGRRREQRGAERHVFGGRGIVESFLQPAVGFAERREQALERARSFGARRGKGERVGRAGLPRRRGGAHFRVELRAARPRRVAASRRAPLRRAALDLLGKLLGLRALQPDELRARRGFGAGVADQPEIREVHGVSVDVNS
jgi:hypothetical protein